MFGNPFELHDDLKTENRSALDPFGRMGVDDEPDTEIAKIKNPTELKASVGDIGQNKRRDVAKTEQLLGQAGTLDLKKTDGPTGFWGSRTSDATKAFQKKNGLKVDGQINPGGETIRALGKLAGQAFKAAQSSNNRSTGARGAKTNTNVVIPAKPGTQSNVFTNWVPDQVRDDNTVDMTDDAFMENQRAARYLASQNGIGDFSKFIADGIETDDHKAIAETVDLYRQTAEMNQAQADALIKKVIPSLSSENAKRLKSAIKSAEQESNETISIGVWPDGEGPSVKAGKENRPPGVNFGNSATDDETSNDDNPRFSRDWRDEALQHLIESGLDADSAKKFLELLPQHVTDEHNSLVDALTTLSGQLKNDKPDMEIPHLVIGGFR